MFQRGVSEVGLEGAQEGKGVAGKSHRGSSANKRDTPFRIWASLPSHLRVADSSGPLFPFLFFMGEASTNTSHGKHFNAPLTTSGSQRDFTCKQEEMKRQERGGFSLWAHIFPQEMRDDFFLFEMSRRLIEAEQLL